MPSFVAADLNAVTASDADANEELLALVRAGGSHAAAQLIYRRFSDLVNATIWRLLGPDADHDDLVNESFLRIIGGIAQLRDSEKLIGWIVTVTANVVRDEFRKRSLRRRWLRRLGPQEVEDRPAVDIDHHGRRLLRCAFDLMSRLPTDERLAFALRYVDRRTLPETAAIVGCSLATVKRRISRAERRFRRLAAREPELAEWLQTVEGEKGPR